LNRGQIDFGPDSYDIVWHGWLPFTLSEAQLHPLRQGVEWKHTTAEAVALIPDHIGDPIWRSGLTHWSVWWLYDAEPDGDGPHGSPHGSLFGPVLK
jgi:hypothetical protein